MLGLIQSNSVCHTTAIWHNYHQVLIQFTCTSQTKGVRKAKIVSNKIYNHFTVKECTNETNSEAGAIAPANKYLSGIPC